MMSNDDLKQIENSSKAKILTDEEYNYMNDTLENLIGNLGNSSDIRSSSQFVNNKMLSHYGNRTELNALYRTSWIAGKIVDIIPDDMTREWRKFDGDITPDTVKMLVDEENRLELRTRFNDADKLARLFGTAFIVMSIDDGNTPEKPLEIDKIKPNGLRFIHAVDRYRMDTSEVQPVQNPLDKNFGMPEFYRIVDSSQRIHHSRVLRFDGIKIPFDEFKRNNYFNDSVLSRIYEDITNATLVSQGCATMVYESNVDVIKVKGLMNYLQTPSGEAMLKKRFATAKLVKSFNNMLLLDNEESYDIKSTSFSGLHELLDKYLLILSGASDIPATRFLGSSANGLNATGQGDLKNYYDTIGSKQVIDYKPKLDYFDLIMAKSLGLSDDADLSYIFNSLFQMTPNEIADLELKNAQRDQIYLTNEVIPISTVTKELKQNGTYTNITDEYIALLEGFENGTITDPNIDQAANEQENEGEQDENDQV